jgi:hypothetical protein
LCARDRGRSGHRDTDSTQCRRGGRERVAGRDHVIDDHHAIRVGQSRVPPADDELAHRRRAALRSRELGGVRTIPGQRQERGDPHGVTPPAQDLRRVPGHSLDVLSAAAAGRGDRGGDGDEPQRPVTQLGDRGRQGGPERPSEVAPTPLLEGQQAGTCRSGVRRGHGQRRQAGRGRLRSVRPGTDDRLPATRADRAACGGAAGTPAWQGQIGQYGEHATTVPPADLRRKSRLLICG